MKNYCIFDTETIGVNKPFCYNIGYVIVNENGETLLKREYVVSEIWNNLPLFSTAYYVEKRPIYEAALKEKSIQKHSFNYICNVMRNDFILFEIDYAYAFNSNFDERVFEFNCDWFKVVNPFENIKVLDIRGYAHNFIVNTDYKNFCDKYEYYTESGNYSSTAETVYRFIKDDTSFIESHTALSDSEIECEILFACVKNGAKLETDYPCMRSIEKKSIRNLIVKKNKEEILSVDYTKIRINKDKTEINLN